MLFQMFHPDFKVGCCVPFWWHYYLLIVSLGFVVFYSRWQPNYGFMYQLIGGLRTYSCLQQCFKCSILFSRLVVAFLFVILLFVDCHSSYSVLDGNQIVGSCTGGLVGLDIYLLPMPFQLFTPLLHFFLLCYYLLIVSMSTKLLVHIPADWWVCCILPSMNFFLLPAPLQVKPMLAAQRNQTT